MSSKAAVQTLEINSLTPEEILDRVEDVTRHQDHVKEGCDFLGKKLIKAGRIELGVALIRNGRQHDSTKLQGIEFLGLTQVNDPNLLTVAIAHHQQVNPHHPEYWQGIDNMPEIYLAEMVCDWRARSIEFGSNLRDWIKETATEKYKIAIHGKTNKMIKEFVDLLLDEPFKNPTNTTYAKRKQRTNRKDRATSSATQAKDATGTSH